MCVHDDGTGGQDETVAVHPVAVNGTGGGGLALVAEFAAAWGVRRSVPGTTVWATLAI